MSRASAISFVLCALASACTGSPRRADSASGAVRVHGADSVAVPLALPATLPPVAARPVRWTDTLVVARLRHAGLAVAVRGGFVREPMLGPRGSALVVRGSAADSAELLLFYYAGADAAGRDVARLDSAAAPGRRAYVAWRAPASVVTDNNLVAIIATADATLRQRIAAIFSSGAPD